MSGSLCSIFFGSQKKTTKRRINRNKFRAYWCDDWDISFTWTPYLITKFERIVEGSFQFYPLVALCWWMTSELFLLRLLYQGSVRFCTFLSRGTQRESFTFCSKLFWENGLDCSERYFNKSRTNSQITKSLFMISLLCSPLVNFFLLYSGKQCT